MTDLLTIRAVHPDEHTGVGLLTVRAYAGLQGDHLTDGYAAELRDVERRARKAVVLVAVHGERGVVGAVTYVPDHHSAYSDGLVPGEAGIRHLAVDPTARGLGVGNTLLTTCITRARDERAVALLLHSTPFMDVAVAMYQRRGFVRAPGRDILAYPELPILGYVLRLSPDRDPTTPA